MQKVAKQIARQGIGLIMLIGLLLPHAWAAGQITCTNDAEDVVTGAGTGRNPWILTVGNTYQIKTGKRLKDSDCLDANWYVVGDNKNYIEIVGSDFNTVEPKIKAIGATGNKVAQLKFEHQVYQPENGDVGVWTAVDYYCFRIQEPQGAAEPDEPEPEPEPAKPTKPVESTKPDTGTGDKADSSDTSAQPDTSPGNPSDGSSGTCDNSLTWRVDGHTLTISGSGEMDLHFKEAPWYPHRRDIQVVTIEPGVTSVDYAAFQDFKLLDSVLIPDTVTELGSDVFLRCKALEYITLPDSIGKIPSTLFANCTSLKSLDIPKGVTKIEMFAFQKCTSLESVSIPTSVKRIESTAFVDCTGLKDVYYDGTAAQWEQIDIGSENDALSQAVLHTSDNKTGTRPGAGSSSGSGSSVPSDAPSSSSSSSPSGSTPDSGSDSSGNNSSNSGPGSSSGSKPSSTPATSSVHGGAWYASAMDWAYTNSFINDADYHAPLNACPRSSIVLYLWRAKGCPAAKSKHTFQDLSSGALYYDAVQWAVDAGIITGFQDNSFRPTGTLTRAQLVTILQRASGDSTRAGSTRPVSFRDVPQGAWYEKAIQWAVANDITKGTSATEFSPNGTCNIAQVLTFLQRLLG